LRSGPHLATGENGLANEDEKGSLERFATEGDEEWNEWV